MRLSASLRASRAVFGLAILVILVLALMPASTTPDVFPQADKCRHAAAFVALWWLGARSRLMGPGGLVLALLALGVGIEVAQSFTPDREPSVWDVVADLVGVALGWRLRPMHSRSKAA